MSLVGPRPERLFFVREFARTELRYDDRHRVQTGLTGYAQVHDLRGDTDRRAGALRQLLHRELVAVVRHQDHGPHRAGGIPR